MADNKMAIDPQNNDESHSHWSGSLVLLVPYLKELVTYISVSAMIFGGVVPYIPQYRKIRKTRDCEGFSVYVCLVLLVANILRIFFWFGVHYELPLLIQSLIMTVTMLVMMHICVTVKKESTPTTIHRSIWDINYFWKWTDFREYLIFTGLFSAIGFIVTLLLINVSVFVELLGFASLFTEAMLGLPQFWRNYKHKSTEGMSIQMVLFWLSGDTFKTVYFIMRGAPVQFVVCGSLQVMVDIAILSQVVVYRRKRQHFISSSLSIKS